MLKLWNATKIVRLDESCTVEQFALNSTERNQVTFCKKEKEKKVRSNSDIDHVFFLSNIQKLLFQKQPQLYSLRVRAYAQ